MRSPLPSLNTRETLARELAEERFATAEEEAHQGGSITAFKATKVEDFMEEALAFVDRCIAVGKQP